MKALDARDLARDELQDKLRELKEEHFDLRFKLATGQVDNHRRIRQIRHEIAMINTILRERELDELDAAQPAAAEEGTE